MQQQDWFPYKDEIRSMRIEEFIESHPIDALTNYQVKMIAGRSRGMPGDMTPYDCSPSDRSLLAEAKKNVADHYHVVITERFDESVLLLQRKLDWRNAYYINSNVTKIRKRKTDLDESVIDLIRRHNVLDIELYEHVVQEIDAEITGLGETFQQELRAFRKTNERLNRICYRPINRLLTFGRKIHVAGHRRQMKSAFKSE